MNIFNKDLKGIDLSDLINNVNEDLNKSLKDNGMFELVEKYRNKNVVNKSDVFGTSHKRDDDMLINISSNDFSVLCVCALRYCQGRQTYMPKMIQDIVMNYIDAISDIDLNVMIEDKKMLEFTGYGDNTIDKPNWEKFYHKLNEIKEERGIK